jgi:hypothetical protein
MEQISDTVWMDDFNHVIVQVHKRGLCVNENCTIHNPSGHSMLHFPQLWRADRKFMERVCPHGIGHPDPDEINKPEAHGCDGCCQSDSV